MQRGVTNEQAERVSANVGAKRARDEKDENEDGGIGIVDIHRKTTEKLGRAFICRRVLSICKVESLESQSKKGNNDA